MVRSIRVVVLDDTQHAAMSSADWSPLDGRAEVSVLNEHIGDENKLVAALSGVNVVVAMRERTTFNESLLARLPDLRLLVMTGMTTAAIDVATARRNGVVVCGTDGSTAPDSKLGSSTSELAWLLVMALLRQLRREDAELRRGGWQSGIGSELAGLTLGLLGLGAVGQRVARYAQAFEMNVLAWSENLKAEHADLHGVRLVSKSDLFERSDVVSIHVRLSNRTRGIVGAPELALLGPDGYLVNTSRGPIVDEASLVEALRLGTIKGAGLDVYEVEPLPKDHPLRGLENTILTPHIGYGTIQGYRTMYREVVEDIVAWLDGKPLRELLSASISR